MAGPPSRDKTSGKNLVPELPVITTQYLCQLLVREGLLTDAQRKDVVVKEREQRARLQKERRELQFTAGKAPVVAAISAAEVIASLKLPLLADPSRLVSEDLIQQELAKEIGMPFVKIDPLKLDMELVTQTISRPFARKHTIVPIAKAANLITVAVDDPLDQDGLDGLKRASGCELAVVLATRSDILKIINEFYGFRTSVTAAARELKPGFDLGNLEQYVKMKPAEAIDAADQPIINAVEYLFRYAYDQRASDIHLEPKRDYSLVRFRIDGVLHDIHQVPKPVHAAFVARIKILSRLDIAEKRRPQDGRIKTDHRGKEVELRISTLPVAFGEKVVVRIFDPEVIMQDLSELGFFPREFELFNTFISQPHGMILVTGPTGSGKTTTLYSALRALSTSEINITTIEDPIEMVYDEFNQVAVQPKIEISFASSLRNILRQDPDVIMVGEIRDFETAQNAVQAALTGHLVFSTLHTNDAASAVTRLLDLGVEPFLISSTLIGTVAQRLVRQICPHCKKEKLLEPEDLKLLRFPVKDAGQKLPVFFGEGCLDCRQTGYFGRIGLFEVLEMNEKQKKLINARADSVELRKAAVEDGMMLLRECAIKKLAMGVTTFEEVLRVTAF